MAINWTKAYKSSMLTINGGTGGLVSAYDKECLVRRIDMKSSSEKRLIMSGFVIAVAALLMAILPFGLFILSFTSRNQEPGSRGFSEIHGYMMLSLIGVTWLGNFVLLLVNAILNRAALRSRFGIATIVHNLVVFLNVLFWAWIIKNDLIG